MRSTQVALLAVRKTKRSAKSKHTATMNESEINLPEGALPFKHGFGYADITGIRFGMLTAIRPAYRLKGKLMWEFSCDCGTIKIANGTYVRTGQTKSCGCLAAPGKAVFGVPVKTLREHRIWHGMISRCENPNLKEYKYYGAKGISVCESWRKTFLNFFSDMGKCPNGLTLDRIDSKGNYEPGNCRWASHGTQARNTSGNIMVSINGESKCVCEWLEHFGLKKATYLGRLKSGWTREMALKTPVRASVGWAVEDLGEGMAKALSEEMVAAMAKAKARLAGSA